MAIVMCENSAEWTVEIVGLKDLGVRHRADRAASNALPAFEPRRIEQAVVSGADEPTSFGRHRQHFGSLLGIERERLLDVDVRARADGLLEEAAVRRRRRRNMDDVGPRAGEQSTEVGVPFRHRKTDGGLPGEIRAVVAHGHDCCEPAAPRGLQMSVRDLAASHDRHSNGRQANGSRAPAATAQLDTGRLLRRCLLQEGGKRGDL